jgi:hypothetical protein
MTIIQNQNTKANPDEKLAVQLSGEIQKQLGICFKKTDGTLRGTCPACEEDATLRIELITPGKWTHSIPVADSGNPPICQKSTRCKSKH